MIRVLKLFNICKQKRVNISYQSTLYSHEFLNTKGNVSYYPTATNYSTARTASLLDTLHSIGCNIGAHHGHMLLIK